MSSKTKTIEELLKSNSITLTKFLTIFYGVSGDVIHNKKISHKDIKYMMPYVKRASFEEVRKNMYKLYTGEIVSVVDSFGQVVPYIAPEFALLDDEEIQKQDISEYRDNKIKELLTKENLTRFELVLIGRYYKERNRLCDYRINQRMIKAKKDNSIKYKQKKLTLKMKGREELDEY